MKIHHLYIDELGSPNPKSPQHTCFVLSACSFHDGIREIARQHAESIKFKYWGTKGKSITFHSAEIGRKAGAFAIFKGKPQLYQEFLSDLLEFLKTYQIVLFVNVTDHVKARANNWDTSTVLSKSSSHIIESFVRYLIGCHAKGKVIVESATDEQNRFFLQAFTFHLSPNAISQISYRSVQEALTSLSIVTKNNHDIEEQIADMFAYAAKCKYQRDKLGAIFKPASYEEKLIGVLEKKLYTVPKNTASNKAKVLSKIDSFKVLI